MATAGAQPINYQSPLGGGLLEAILGRNTNTQQSGSQLSNQVLNGLTTANGSGTQTSTSTSTADLDALRGVYATGMAGMTPDMISSLISSIFTEGAQGVPALIGAYANSAGARASRNSGLQLALGDLNRSLSSQVVQQLLQYNQAALQTAGNAATQIAGNTRGGTTQTANTTQNQQQQAQTTTGATQNQQTTQQRQSVNPSSAGLLGLGGTALNFLDRKGVFNSLFGNSGSGGAGAGITGTMGTPGPIYGGAASQLGGGSSVFANNGVAPSSGLVAQTPQFGGAAPVAGGGGGFLGGGGLGSAAGGGGVLDGGAFSGAGMLTPATTGILGATGGAAPQWGTGGIFGNDYFGTGNLWGGNNVDVFGTAGTGSLGSNLDFGNLGYNYDTPGGITGIMSGLQADDVASAAGGGAGDFLGGIGGFFSDASDWLGGFFADGGFVNHVVPGPEAQLARTMNTYRPGGYADGGLVKRTQQSLNSPTGMSPDPAQFVPGGVARSTFADLQLGHVVPGVPMVGYADGGQVQTGASSRNTNQMGPQLRRPQSSAINYDGYAPTGGVGASIPAGISGGISPAILQLQQQNNAIGDIQPVAGDLAPKGPAVGSPQQTAALVSDPDRIFLDYVTRANIIANQQNPQGAGSDATVGATPSQDEGTNGQAGIGPTGIAAAPNGTTAAVSLGLNAIGLPSSIPGLPVNPLALIAMIASLVNQANQGSGGVTGGLSGDSNTGNTSPAGTGGTVDGVGPGVDGSPDGGNASGSAAATGAGVGDGIGGDTGGTSSTGAGVGADGTGGGGGTADGYADGRKIAGYMRGGQIRGAGTGISDSISAKVSEPGGPDIKVADEEFIIPTDVVRHFGADYFHKLIDSVHTPVNR